MALLSPQYSNGPVKVTTSSSSMSANNSNQPDKNENDVHATTFNNAEIHFEIHFTPTGDDKEYPDTKNLSASDFFMLELEKEYNTTLWLFEHHMLMHKLAATYFGFQAFWYIFLPQLLLTTIISIIGFTVMGEIDPDPDDALEEDLNGESDGDDLTILNDYIECVGLKKNAFALSISVGVLGAAAGLINSIGKWKNIQSRFDMHSLAARALKNITKTVVFEQRTFQRKKIELAHESSTKGHKAVCFDMRQLGVDLKTHQASFEAMLDACQSEIPSQIEQVFVLLHELMDRIDYGDFQKLNYRYFLHLLVTNISVSPLFPFHINHVDIHALLLNENERNQENNLMIHNRISAVKDQWSKFKRENSRPSATEGNSPPEPTIDLVSTLATYV